MRTSRSIAGGSSLARPGPARSTEPLDAARPRSAPASGTGSPGCSRSSRADRRERLPVGPAPERARRRRRTGRRLPDPGGARAVARPASPRTGSPDPPGSGFDDAAGRRGSGRSAPWTPSRVRTAPPAQPAVASAIAAMSSAPVPPRIRSEVLPTIHPVQDRSRGTGAPHRIGHRQAMVDQTPSTGSYGVFATCRTAQARAASAQPAHRVGRLAAGTHPGPAARFTRPGPAGRVRCPSTGSYGRLASRMTPAAGPFTRCPGPPRARRGRPAPSSPSASRAARRFPRGQPSLSAGRTSLPKTSMNSAWLRPTLWRWISSKPMST